MKNVCLSVKNDLNPEEWKVEQLQQGHRREKGKLLYNLCQL